MEPFNTINELLFHGEINNPGILPHLEQLKTAKYVFNIDFGLPELPTEPGILMIRGARQYGKSTWLEQQLYQSIQKFGAGSAFYLNGDTLANEQALEIAIQSLLPSFHKDAPVKRIFIDEITAIDHWEKALKRLADVRAIKDILLITTGSRATDLRRGSERLPGRKGKLARSTFLFTPIAYKEFKRVCGHDLQEKTFLTYLISGGSPIACAELAEKGILPEYVIELVRDWIEGEIALQNRNRNTLLNIMSVLFRFGGTPVGQAKLARESGVTNNTVVQGYIEILQDLACVTPAFPWDQNRHLLILRKPSKFHFTNLLAALVYHPNRIRSIENFLKLSLPDQGMWYEWLIAQEIFRRSAIQGEHILEPLSFWQSQNHEIDFVLNSQEFVEVKLGKSSPLEFAWFPKQFPSQQLTVINSMQFATNQICGVTAEEFLLADY